MVGMITTVRVQVIFQDGHPFRWLFTSKRGEIMRKRQIDVAQIISRMGRASDKCVIRYLPHETAQVRQMRWFRLRRFLRDTSILAL